MPYGYRPRTAYGALRRMRMYRSPRYSAYRARAPAARAVRRADVGYVANVPRPFRTPLLLPKQGFPERLTVNLPWMTSLRVNPGIVPHQDYVLAPNNANDLDITGGGAGAQPRGYDQWAAQYGQYRVNYVDCRITIRQRAAHGIVAYAIFNNQATALLSNRLGEIHNSLFLGETSSNTDPIVRRFRYDPARALGMSSTEYQTSDTTLGDVGADVPALSYLHLAACQIDNLTVLDIEMTIELLVNVTFSRRLNIGAS